jgi:hypothetical protein
VQTDVMNDIAMKIVRGEVKEGSVVSVSVEKDEIQISLPKKKATARKKKTKTT